MTPSKINRKYGWKPDVPDIRDLHLKVECVESLPELVDLRSGMPPVYDQGQLGSCTGNSIAGAVEFMQKKEHAAWDFTPSRLFIYYNERVVEGTVKTDSGAQIRTGIQVVNKQGVCKETLWPYDVAKFTNKPLATCYKNATLHKALKYQRVNQTLVDLQTVLAGGNVWVFGFSVYESFESQAVATTGIVPMPVANEEMLGGHAVCACGYDNSDNTFLVRNSWGADWGIGGYFKIPYAYILNENLCDDLWTISQMQ
jgi:C1A family cysteine protease